MIVVMNRNVHMGDANAIVEDCSPDEMYLIFKNTETGGM